MNSPELSAQRIDRDNAGVLFRNHQRPTEKHPLYTGHATIGGAEFWLSAWLKEAKDGTKYMSLSFRAKNPASQPAEQPF